MAPAVFMALFALSFPGFLFLPYFHLVNKWTADRGNVILGSEIALGRDSGIMRTAGSTLLLSFDIIGTIGAFLTLLFLLWLLFQKKVNPYQFLPLALAIPCLSIALAALLLAGPLYEKKTSLLTYDLLPTWQFILSLLLTLVALLLAIVILLKGAILLVSEKTQTRKDVTEVRS